MKKPFLLMILDGFGINPDKYGNAVAAANTPNIDNVFKKYPHTTLNASGTAVGLPEGQMGNSEVGHLNIGAGRVVYQELMRINNAIETGTFSGNAAFLKAVDHVKETGGTLHVMGLLSDGGVHSHINHIKATLSLADSHQVPGVCLHCFTDGRDVPPTSGIDYIKDMESFIADLTVPASFGVISGRYYAMDRDKRWERVQKAYEALTGLSQVDGLNQPAAAVGAPSQILEQAYASGLTDEFIPPVLCNPKAGVKSGDSIIFCNFRPDRARELTRCFVDPDFDGFKIDASIDNLVYVCMTQYDVSMPNVDVAFPPGKIKHTLGEYLSELGLRQLRIAETEKYAHVTFFFNGGVEKPNPLEDRILIPSPKVSTYDLQPEMSAYKVASQTVEEIKSGKYDCIILNFANADMVGHTGIFDAAVKAIEAVDQCAGEVIEAVLASGGQLLLTADHGNADVMVDEKGNPVTAHSTNPVPLIHVARNPAASLDEGGSLCDIAPTMLKLMGLAIPPEMTGRPLI